MQDNDIKGNKKKERKNAKRKQKKRNDRKIKNKKRKITIEKKDENSKGDRIENVNEKKNYKYDKMR